MLPECGLIVRCKLERLLAKRGITTTATALGIAASTHVVHAAPAGLAAITATGALGVGATTSLVAVTKTIAMTTLQKAVVGVTLVCAISAAIFEAQQAHKLRQQIEAKPQQQASLSEQAQKLQRERDDAEKAMLSLRLENEQLHRDTAELLKLRGEVARARNNRAIAAQSDAVQDATSVAAREWLDRVELLKRRFEQWPKKTPELELLAEQDWLDEVAKHKLEDDFAFRESMARLRHLAKTKFAGIIHEALEQFARANNDQMPTELSQLEHYLKPPMASWLQNYDVAKPGWINPPQPNSPNSKRAESWAMITKGTLSAEGVPVHNGSNLEDPEHDMVIVIYRGGSYGYGPDRPAK